MNTYSLFQQSVKKHPERMAIFVDGRAYTYKELAQAVSILSIPLQEAKGHFIGFYAYRSFISFASVLAILKVGKAFVPLSPKFPTKRNLSIANQAALQTIIVDNQADGLPAFLEAINPSIACVIPENLSHWNAPDTPADAVNNTAETLEFMPTALNTIAYMLFTSGSTGEPKGVPISHCNLQAYVNYTQERYNFVPEDRFSNTFDQTFDLSIHDMFVCWSAAGALFIVPEKELLAPYKFIIQNEITCWFSVPSMVNMMGKLRLLKPKVFPSLRYSFFCGEALPLAAALQWQKAAHNSIVENLYGPTEATIAISNYRLPRDTESAKAVNGLLAIGKIFDGQQFLIVNEIDNEVSLGEIGELLLAGSQVTDQYWNNPKKTAEQFIKFSNTNQTWYRTGDLVKEDSEGDLLYLGRKDTQVKINGHRIELSEIDHTIKTFTESLNVATIVSGSKTDKIHSFVIPTEHTEIEIIQHCKSVLPPYMIPFQIHFLDVMPLNANGKTDRNALKAKLNS